MTPADVLNLIERLHLAAHHPDIRTVEQYGHDKPSSLKGVAITYQSGSAAYLFVDKPPRSSPDPAPCPMPDVMPARKTRALHALKFLVELLDAAKPAQFTAWRTVAFEGSDAPGLKPCALAIRCADGSTLHLRVTAGFGGHADQDEAAAHEDYRIPEPLLF